MEEFLSVQEAATRKGVSQATIYKAIQEKRLPATRLLGRFALKPMDIDAYEPGTYAGVQRATKTRGVPRKKQEEAAA